MRSIYQDALIVGVAASIVGSPASAAQIRLDQSDPTIVEKALPSPVTATLPSISITPAVTREGNAVAAGVSVHHAAAVIVEGANDVPETSYAALVTDIVGRDLSRQDLAHLASSIAHVVRSHGYPFATAFIAPQSMANGTIRVTVDRGRIDAVRVIGATSAIADAILMKTLVTHEAVRQADLERALLLVGDIPGIRVKGSRFVQQDGFGILLVTIDRDRASAYVQIDNRGTKEVGPIRATLLGNVRGLATDDDELGLIVAQTPIDISEFTFLRVRYAAPVDVAGSVLAVSGSYGWSHPGASLTSFDVKGRSSDLSVDYVRPLLRRKTQSIWASINLRALTTRQMLASQTLRRDKLATLTGSINGVSSLAGGIARAEVAAQFGMPRPSARSSRSDSDGQFTAFNYQIDWTMPVSGPVTIAVASAGQLASRPLLAVAEIGLGGPSFGRAYDYAERTGDYGVMGSIELRIDAGRVLPGIIDRLQFYGFGDIGSVGNRRSGNGGGTLSSAGTGIRGGVGRVEAMVEIAFPIGNERFATGTREPRISARLARSF
ncbi:ShlB/FhaC/HecB family hemolysin secretion/activation protein [Sphingomonas mollis]|uniref:ShlB/FhaC/HecB family hemolysin secretion/activation protein n=1 Tax=Sphingomonas mollis TaxID=2795726 RepID=A0ABS0XTW8_9SPHN|nr:ShlB/FhaC/HecB family hemolysin secretion/activation protein [Sphingomonas sp. BT553]MBJ6123467.1 ShlB/FhaC/HecB family hemolysin secretion/activation protein [Sphingomonas sp. BT553]